MFAIIKIQEVSIKKNVYKLSINGKIPFDDFFDSCKTNKTLLNQLGHIQSILRYIGMDEEVKIPQKKFKILKRNNKDPHIDYEIKTNDLRIYLIRDKKYGKIVVMGGFKKTQPKDLNKLRKIKRDYFSQQNINVSYDELK